MTQGKFSMWSTRGQLNKHLDQLIEKGYSLAIEKLEKAPQNEMPNEEIPLYQAIRRSYRKQIEYLKKRKISNDDLFFFILEPKYPNPLYKSDSEDPSISAEFQKKFWLNPSVDSQRGLTKIKIIDLTS